MANIVYEDRLYNEKTKLAFMSEYAESTQKILSRLFKVSQTLEFDLDKDLFEFNREQLRRLFFLYLPKTAYSSKANVTWVSKYIDWALEEGYLDGLNPLDGTAKEWKEQFVMKSLKKYWTAKELDKIINKCVNAQDAVLISLLFNGVRGTANSEILNLQKSDILFSTNQLSLRDDDGTSRIITVSDACISLCEKALRESEYEKKNGNASKDIKSPTAALVSNDFVVKTAFTRTEHFHEAEKNIVHRRLSVIGEEINEPNFTPFNICYSGMLALAKDLFLQSGELGDHEYEVVFRQFQEKSDQSIYRIKAEFLNLTQLKELYKIS
ncbi:site-specific integrase [Paenibacillus sp. ACRRX]|uniref:tyrosine-type recombinase/integrase n=1 Tax=unclassified Paenibacillus TaxID=185978 RepID=UPI001EF6760F|nr:MULTISPECIES: site-specific integrase [unclassified Paenibacillus]MCG7406392.1 site-specific integrase [Paenibacillus sp. ACRRX]MDK8179423.1 site-specific integrase [Paenibacillus sp. UMB4589-SE434]